MSTNFEKTCNPPASERILTIPDPDDIPFYNHLDLCRNIDDLYAGDVSYTLIRSPTNQTRVVHSNNVTTQSVIRKRKKRWDHSTDPDSPLFESRIINGDIANIKGVTVRF